MWLYSLPPSPWVPRPSWVQVEGEELEVFGQMDTQTGKQIDSQPTSTILVDTKMKQILKKCLWYYSPLHFYRAHVQRVCELCFHVAVNHKFEGNTTIFYPPTNWNTLVVVLGKRAESSPPSYYDTHVPTHTLMTSGRSPMNEKRSPIKPCLALKPQKSWKFQILWNSILTHF